MTKSKGDKKKKDNLLSGFYSLALLSLTVCFGLVFSAEAAEYVKEGLRIATALVIPSSFPFMIISDLYVHYGKPERIRPLASFFSRLFGMPPTAIAPFICGNIGGFPIGAKMVSQLYVSGRIEKEDAERLIPLCNNPSCAFVVGGVGLGIYRDIHVGFLLLASIYFATIICGLITKTKRKFLNYRNIITEQNYNFTQSVKDTGISCIGIISFICIFSSVLGIIKKRIRNTPILLVIYSLSEVTNAVTFLSSSPVFSRMSALSLTAFSLGFGGICVGMQSSVFTSPCGISLKKYYVVKLLEGALSSLIFCVFFSLL